MEMLDLRSVSDEGMQGDRVKRIQALKEVNATHHTSGKDTHD